MVPCGIWLGPRCLAYGRPDGGFADVVGGFIITAKEANWVRRFLGADCGEEDAGEEGLNGLSAVCREFGVVR